MHLDADEMSGGDHHGTGGTRMRFRPVADLKGERVRDAYPELARFVTRRPPKSQPWRDFWKVSIPSFVLLIVVLRVLDATPYSPLWLAVVVAWALTMVVIGTAFRRLGIIGDRRHRNRRE